MWMGIFITSTDYSLEWSVGLGFKLCGWGFLLLAMTIPWNGQWAPASGLAAGQQNQQNQQKQQKSMKNQQKYRTRQQKQQKSMKTNDF